MLSLSPNTQAILLLTAPLIAGRSALPAELLTPGEYKRLARHLREVQHQPADLIATGATDLLRDCGAVIDTTRLQRLLERGFLLGQVVERWQSRAIWVVSRADAGYPRRLKARLRDDAPAVIYGCGDGKLLDAGGLAVVGSRNVSDALIHYALETGRLAAESGNAVVSGGARGVDQAAMRGALEEGGVVGGVLADSLERTAMNREHRNMIMGGQLTVISPYDPSAGFNAGHAMQRNKLIYALADAALIVNADLKKGGTWTGAVEQLDKFAFVPVYVRSTGEPSAGLDGLRNKGALPWPNPRDADEFARVFDVASIMPESARNLSLFSTAEKGSASVAAEIEASAEPPIDSAQPGRQDEQARISLYPENPAEEGLKLSEPRSAADNLFSVVRTVIRQLLSTPKKDGEIASELDVSKAQAKAWLARLLDEGEIEKRKKPAGYVVAHKKQSNLFD